MDRRTRVLFCDCAYAEVVPAEVRREVYDRLTASGAAFETTEDLCGLCARKDPILKRIADSTDVRIVACFPRAVEWLFHAAGGPLSGNGAEVLNMRELSADEIVSRLRLPEAPPIVTQRAPSRLNGLSPTNAPAAHVSTERSGADAWVPWFPVIDYDRCENCKQCLSFCLFGVYGTDADDRVEVQKPDHCKTGCPACARVCPNTAIIFPKFEEEPINGAVVCDEDIQGETVGVDLQRLVDEGVHSALRERAETERRRFLTQTDESRVTRKCKRCAQSAPVEAETAHEPSDGVQAPDTRPSRRFSTADDRQSPPTVERWDI